MKMQGIIRTDAALELPLPGFLADHAPINYSVLVWNCYDAVNPGRRSGAE